MAVMAYVSSGVTHLLIALAAFAWWARQLLFILKSFTAALLPTMHGCKRPIVVDE
jgi:hypothetical protein